MKIFITGATGFLGRYLVSELSLQFETLYILTRNIEYYKFNHIPNVKMIKGDITNPQIIESINEYAEVVKESNFVIHAAALYDISASHSESYLQNVVGTQNVLGMIKKMKKLKAFYYISTIAVGDDESSLLEEENLPERSIFKDYYSETKYYAEKIIRETCRFELSFPPTRIIRPGMIVGDSLTGNIDKRDGPYFFIEAMRKYSHYLKIIPVLPLCFNPHTNIPIIPVDHCSHFIALLVTRDDESQALKTYHLISDEIPTVKEMLDDLNKKFGVKTKYIATSKKSFPDYLFKLLRIPKEVVPFMFSKLSFSKVRTLKDLPELKTSKYSDYKDKLFIK